MPEKLKILHVSSPGYKSAGKLAFDIHEAFLKAGHTSFMISKDNNYGFANSVSYYNSFFFYVEKYLVRFQNKFRKLITKNQNQDEKYGVHYINHDMIQFHYKNILKKVPFKPDIIIFYALHEFLNTKTMKRIKEESGAEVFWLFYDMAPMTGGCHYSWNCGGYKNECGKCPWLFSDKENDPSRKNMLFKKKYLEGLGIRALICSEWLMKKAVESSLFKSGRMYKWLMPLDTGVFKSDDKIKVKTELGLDPEKRYIMSGSVNLTNKRKGSEYLMEALKELSCKKEMYPDVEIIVLGYGSAELKEKSGFNIVAPGFIYGRDELIKYYQASHIVVVPSIEDTGPLMISESIACGTPVVSFETGSAYDLVHNGKTGYRAELKNSSDLCRGIEIILNMTPLEYEKMSAECRKTAVEKMNIGDQVNRIIDIYENNV
jgi:glycosyltransferase involved in cell wall biosynthesis